MAHITLSIKDQTYNEMKHYSEIKWSEVARKAIEKKVQQLKLLETLLNEEGDLPQNLEELQKKIKNEIAKKHLEEG